MTLPHWLDNYSIVMETEHRELQIFATCVRVGNRKANLVQQLVDFYNEVIAHLFVLRLRRPHLIKSYWRFELSDPNISSPAAYHLGR